MENPTETSKIYFPGKWTLKGANLQHHLFTASGAKIQSTTVNESWTGHNWTDEFIVTKNEIYILVTKYITNTKKHQCRIDQLLWNGEKTSITPLGQKPTNINFRELCPLCFGMC
jgi:hypothetical protein